MANQVPWNALIINEFEYLAALTADERRILETRVQGWSRVKQADELGMSVATVDRIIRRLKDKYDRVQPYARFMPVRKTGK